MTKAGTVTCIEENKCREGCVGETWGKEPVCKTGGNNIYIYIYIYYYIYIKETGCNNVDCIYIAQDTDQQRVLVDMIMIIRIFPAEKNSIITKAVGQTFEAQRSLYVPQSGHYMYHTVVAICTAQWTLYVPHSGHYMCHQFKTQQFHVQATHCIYVFCVNLRTNSDFSPIQH
jgi:hypothetical protein